MTAAPGKHPGDSTTRDPSRRESHTSQRIVSNPKPSIVRSILFGIMLFVWWILTIEIPGWNMFRIVTARGIERQYAPLTAWTYGVTQLWMEHRVAAIVIIFLAVIVHYWLWYRRQRYDVFGKWVFKTAFLVLYIIMYAFFLVILIGMEIPIRTMPSLGGP